MQRPAAEVVGELLDALHATVTAYHPEVLPTPRHLDGLVAGTSFFPGGSGLWRGQAHGGALPATFPVSPVLIVGHNFDSQRAFQRSLLRRGEAGVLFWQFLLRMLEAAALPPEECFFTNALMGLKPGSATGAMPRVPGYLAQCAAFLQRQVEITGARCAVALGANADLYVRQLPLPSVTVRHPSAFIYVRGALRPEGLQEEGRRISALLTSLR